MDTVENIDGTDGDAFLKEIERFLEETGMGHSYFGKKAVGNSEVVARLRAGGDIRRGTEARIREFMRRESCDEIVEVDKAQEGS